jgi:dihydroorotase
MRTRREFFHAAAVAAAAVTAVPRLLAARYDVLIKGGRVIDPSQRIDRIADLAISEGRIVDLRPDLMAADAAEVIAARGKVVSAGLVDIHAHASPEMLPAHCLSTGVTSLLDAGSRGADNVDELVEIAKAAPNRSHPAESLPHRSRGTW